MHSKILSIYNKDATVCTSIITKYYILETQVLLSVLILLSFALYFLKLAELFSKDGMSFLASCQNLVPRPWVIDDLDTFILKWGRKSWKKASYTCNIFQCCSLLN